GDHRVLAGSDDAVDRPPLVATVGAGAVEVVDLPDAATGQLFDLATELDERHVQRVGEHLPEGGLARPAQADQRDAALPATLATLAAELLGEQQPHAAQVRLAA